MDCKGSSLYTHRFKTITKIGEWLVARGFVNNISSSTMCFSVVKTLINETAQYLASEPVSESFSDPVSEPITEPGSGPVSEPQIWLFPHHPIPKSRFQPITS